jgi:hypothetical protein
MDAKSLRTDHPLAGGNGAVAAADRMRGPARATDLLAVDELPAAALSEPALSAAGRRVRRLLERLVVRHRRAAAMFRASRRATEAARAEQFASRLRLMLDEPLMTRRMHALSGAVHESADVGVLLQRALEGAISLAGGDFGNVQLCNPATGTLSIAAESGFSSEFLQYFAVVDDASSACGRAAIERSQTIIADVREDARFAPHREIAASSGFRAVQSTPLVDPTGRMCGVISTHFRRVHRPSARDAQIMEWYAEKVAAAVSDRPRALTLVR